MRILSALLLSITATTAQATGTTYECEIDGKRVTQSDPCSYMQPMLQESQKIKQKEQQEKLAKAYKEAMALQQKLEPLRRQQQQELFKQQDRLRRIQDQQFDAMNKSRNALYWQQQQSEREANEQALEQARIAKENAEIKAQREWQYNVDRAQEFRDWEAQGKTNHDKWLEDYGRNHAQEYEQKARDAQQ